MIQVWHSFLDLANKDPDHFHYKVVFGNSEEVGAEIRARAGMKGSGGPD